MDMENLSPLQIVQKVWNPLGYHIHHITPRCLGGSDDWDNLVPLLPEDHKLLHKQLAEETEHSGLKSAAALMDGHRGVGYYTFEHRSRGGKSRFKRYGNFATPESLAKGGSVQGNVNRINGHFDRIKTPESLAKGGSVVGKLLWWTNGKQNKRSMTQPSVDFLRGRTDGLNSQIAK